MGDIYKEMNQDFSVVNINLKSSFVIFRDLLQILKCVSTKPPNPRNMKFRPNLATTGNILKADAPGNRKER